MFTSGRELDQGGTRALDCWQCSCFWPGGWFHRHLLYHCQTDLCVSALCCVCGLQVWPCASLWGCEQVPCWSTSVRQGGASITLSHSLCPFYWWRNQGLEKLSCLLWSPKSSVAELVLTGSAHHGALAPSSSSGLRPYILLPLISQAPAVLQLLLKFLSHPPVAGSPYRMEVVLRFSPTAPFLAGPRLASWGQRQPPPSFLTYRSPIPHLLVLGTSSVWVCEREHMCVHVYVCVSVLLIYVNA